MKSKEWTELTSLFEEMGYELRNEPTQENPWTVVIPDGPLGERRVLWRTRAAHTLWAIYRTIQVERGLA